MSNRALKSEFTEKARAIRLHKHGKVLRIRGASRGVVDHEVGGPQVEARVAVEDAEGPQEGAVPFTPMCGTHQDQILRMRMVGVCATPLTYPRAANSVKAPRKPHTMSRAMTQRFSSRVPQTGTAAAVATCAIRPHFLSRVLEDDHVTCWVETHHLLDGWRGVRLAC